MAVAGLVMRSGGTYIWTDVIFLCVSLGQWGTGIY